jgi:integrase
MYSEGRQKAKIGVVQIDIKRNSYRIRFTYPLGTRHEFIISQVTKEGWTTAIRAAQLINRDIDLGDFDETYSRYSPKHSKALEIASKVKSYNLLELWEIYKESKGSSVAKTTQKNHWKTTDKALNRLSIKALDLKNAELTLKELLAIYSKSVTVRVYTDITSAINLAIKQGNIGDNPHNRIGDDIAKLRKEAKNTDIECFEPREIREIIATFYSDAYSPSKSAFKHSHFAPFVDFLAMSGTRPEEAIALNWDDVKQTDGKTFIRINKVFSDGILLPFTKQKTVRLFPCNDQMIALLASCPRSSNLIFPSHQGTYIGRSNFRNRYWKPVLDGLDRDGKIEKYLKPYCLRHSAITRWIRSGMDIATVAALAGTSTDMIVKHYLASNRSIVVPEL